MERAKNSDTRMPIKVKEMADMLIPLHEPKFSVMKMAEQKSWKAEE